MGLVCTDSQLDQQLGFENKHPRFRGGAQGLLAGPGVILDILHPVPLRLVHRQHSHDQLCEQQRKI